MGSIAGYGPLTGDPNQAEFPTEVPSQIGLLARLCRWAISAWDLCPCTDASRNVAYQNLSAESPAAHFISDSQWSLVPVRQVQSGPPRKHPTVMGDLDVYLALFFSLEKAQWSLEPC